MLDRLPLESLSAASLPKRARRQSKLDAILNGAAALFNEAGIGAVSLSDVAARVGVGRATLYHYVSDREDLVFQCFQRSCARETERIALAAENPDPLAGVLQYFRDCLTSDVPLAIVTDLDYMSGDGRSIIVKAIRRNYQALVDILAEGIAKHRIRPCDERIVAHALTSMIAHIQMARRWLDAGSLPLDAEALVESIRVGVATDASRTFTCTLDVDQFSRLKAAPFGKGGMGEMRVEQILMVASRMFNARGIEAVSLDQIASELGATRGVVYHYFSDKENLAQRCADRAYEIYSAIIDLAEIEGDDSFEKLSIISHLNAQALAGSLQPLALWIGLDAFGPGHQREHRERLQSLLRRTVALAEAGITEGNRRTFDPAMTAVARSGAFSWIPRWEPPVEGATSGRIADELVALFNRGLALHATR